MKTHGVVAWRPGQTWRSDGTGAGSFHVRCTPHVAVKLKRLLPRANPGRTGWIAVSDTPEVARDLEWLTERYPMEMDDWTAARLRERASAHRKLEETIERILGGERVTGDDLVYPARDPRDYQLVAADLAATTGRLLLLDVLGLGKSMSAILVMRDPKLLPAVVVCYPHLERQWAGEIAATFPWALTHAVNKGTPYDPAKLRSTGFRRPDVLIVGWSKLRGWGQHLAGEAQTVVFDEVQELRTGYSSQKYVAAATVADQAACRIGLSATPVYNYGGEIHNIVQVLAPDVLGDREEFVREWCAGPTYDGTGQPEEPRLASGSKLRVRDPAALGLYLRDQGVMLRRTRRDVGRELPPTDRVPHVVDVDEHMMESLSGEVVDIADAYLARETSGKDRFLLGGELDWRLRRLTGLSKAPYVAAFVEALLEEDPEERVLLYGWHRDVYEQWRRRLAAHDPVFYTGTESKNQKHESFLRFTQGESRILIASLRAGAGLDGLQGHSRTIVFGELDWSPGVHEQCIGRLERDGMGDPVTAFFLYCESGSDPVVMETLALKRSQSEPLIDPNADPFAPITHDDSRVRRLAEAVKSRHKR